MKVKREHAGVVLVFGGFAVLVLVFRGVWGNAWHALTGHDTGTGSGATASGALASAQQVALQPGAFGLEFPTPAAGALPGSAPKPAATKFARELVYAHSHPPQGDPTGSSPSEQSNLTYAPAGSSNPQPSWGGWLSQGPGHYVARKFNATTPGGGSDTRWIYVGA